MTPAPYQPKTNGLAACAYYACAVLPLVSACVCQFPKT